jgi:hypothetical protein
MEMKPIRSDGKVWLRVVIITGCTVVLASVLVVLGSRYRNNPITITGAIVQKDDDPRKQSPITDVRVTVAGDQDNPVANSNLLGYFSLLLPPGVRRGQSITLQFHHPKYQPLDLKTVVGNNLYVIHMVPLRTDDESASNRPDMLVTNVLVRYSTETSAEVNIGTGVKTFQVLNTGGTPCDSHFPCSPDGRWKAAIGSASLDAGQGNVFEDARVSCIAGPCPFTKIESDGFSRGGRNITVSVRDWSDTTTFLFEAEVFQEQVNDIVRQSYPVIFGRTFNFSLPATAEGLSLEAELGGAPITFPLGPDPNLSWAACTVISGKAHSTSYRCELKRGYTFQ